MQERQFRIAQMRKRARMTQQEVADRLGMKVAAYGDWERETTMLNLKNAADLADIFGCTLDELAGRNPSGGSLSADEITILDGYRAAEETHKAAMLMNARFQLTLAEQAASKKEGVAEAG